MSGAALTKLVVAGNRSSRWRLAGIAAGVMIGVSLSLLLFAASQAFGERTLRSTWADVYVHAENARDFSDPATPLAPHEAAVSSTVDRYRDMVIRVFAVGVPAEATIRIPGVDQVPSAGEYVASPALAALIESVPAEELGDRFGTQVGTIGEQALEGPDSLVAVVGTDLEELAASGRAVVVTELTGYDFSSQGYRIVALIGAIAVLIPVLLLIAIVTDLGAAQRAERFATLRLIGATPGQVARIAALETAATTLAGAVLGVALYLATIPAAAQLVIESSRFYPRDLLTSPTVMLVAIVLTVVGATAIAWWRTRRAVVGPLGATRERHERPPTMLALVPLLIGVVLLYLSVAQYGRGSSIAGNGLLLIGSFILTTLGLLIAGPLLTAWAARLGRARAHTAAQVIGYNRIVRHPRAVFRAVAGLVVAVYTVTVFAVGITAATAVQAPEEGDGRLSLTTVYALVDTDRDTSLAMVVPMGDMPGAIVVANYTYDGDIILTGRDAVALGIEASDAYVSVWDGWLYDQPAMPEPVTADAMSAPGRSIVFVATDGSPSAIERARTAIIASDLALAFLPATRADNASNQTLTMANQFAALAYVGILIAAAISAVSLAVSTMGATIARRRLFAMLRLTGMPHADLRSIITYEMVLPVASVLLTSIGVGGFTAWAIVTGLSADRTVSWPIPGYYVVLAACAALAGLAVAATARSARRLVSGTTIRFE